MCYISRKCINYSWLQNYPLVNHNNSDVFYFADTHALVRFPDDFTAVVPVGRITPTGESKSKMAEGDDCSVLWSNRKLYKAVLVVSGKLSSLYLQFYQHSLLTDV